RGARRDAAGGVLARRAARAAGRAGKGEPRRALARDPQAPTGGAREEGDGGVAALVAHLDREDLPAQICRLAVLAAADEVVGRRGVEAVEELLDVGGGVDGELDARPGWRAAH